MQFDVFISYASEERTALAEPLYRALAARGLSVFFDEDELVLGASVFDTVDDALAATRFVVAVVSQTRLTKDSRWLTGELATHWKSGNLIPVVDRMERSYVERLSPLLADAKYLTYDGANLDEVADAIAARVGVAGAQAPADVAVEWSHDQRQWYGLTARVERSAARRVGNLLDTASWSDAAVLVAPPPYHMPWQPAELDVIEDWVRGGGGLLILGHYAPSHHETNMNALAWRFEFEFGDDLLMPAGSDTAHRGTRSQDPRYAVQAEGAALLHACSVWASFAEEPSIRVTAPAGTQMWRPVGYVDDHGHRPAIQDYALHHVVPGSGGSVEPVHLVLGHTRHGSGRVAIAGTAKLFTVEPDGNAAFVDGLLTWLAGRPVQLAPAQS